MKKIELNGEVYIRELKGTDIRIVVLQRGWVIVGYYEINDNECIVRNPSFIRVWGTTRGLGEIAKNGPTEKTKLDKAYGDIRFDILTSIFTLDCEEEKWENVL